MTLCNSVDEILVHFDDAKNKGARFDAAFYIDTLYDAVVNILCTGEIGRASCRERV